MRRQRRPGCQLLFARILRHNLASPLYDRLSLRQDELLGMRGISGSMHAGHELQSIGLQRGSVRDRQDMRLQLQLV
jgi:hypothetical protein